MKVVISFLCLVFASGVWADESCRVELQSGARITPSAIEFTDQDKPQYKILNDQTLWVNDRKLPLDSKQQALVNQYSTSLRALVPEVRDLTLAVVDLATDTTSMVFDEFLAADNTALQAARDEFGLLKREIAKKFAEGEPISINQKGMQSNNFAIEDFDERLRAIGDNIGKEFAWTMIKNIGLAALSSDGSNSFDAHMKSFDQKIKEAVERKSQNIEYHAQILCVSIMAVDAKEEALKASVKELSQFNFIQLKKTSI